MQKIGCFNYFCTQYKRLCIKLLVLIIIANKTMTEIISIPQDTKQLSSPQSLVSAYLRLPSAQSVKVQLAPIVDLEELRIRAQQLLKVPRSNQILYLRGRHLQSGLIEVPDRAIFHVKDSRDMLQQITIDIIRHEPQPQNFFKVNNAFTTININQTETVQAFAERFLGEKLTEYDLKRSRIIQCGRFLKLQKTFGQLNIQKGAQVHVIFKQKIRQDIELEQKQNIEHQKLVDRVLKHSRNNSLTQQFRVEDSKEQQAKMDFQLLHKGLFKIKHLGEEITKIQSHQLLPSSQVDEGQVNHICNVEGEEGQNQEQQCSIIEHPQVKTEFDKMFRSRMRRSLLLSHTKSSQKWIRQKVVKPELVPLKLGLREYKRYDGPLSVRACNCKKKNFQSQELVNSQIKSEDSEKGTLSPLTLSKCSKSQTNFQNKLKKSMTFQT